MHVYYDGNKNRTQSSTHSEYRYPAYVAIATVILAQAYGIACIIDWLYEPGLHNFATVVEVMQCYRISTRTNF